MASLDIYTWTVEMLARVTPNLSEKKNNGREHLWFKAKRFYLKYVENDLIDLPTSCGLKKFSLNAALCTLLVVLNKYFGRSDVITLKQF